MVEEKLDEVEQAIIADYNETKLFPIYNNSKTQSINQNKRTENDIPLRRFVINTDNTVVKMADTFKLNDLRNKVILGKLYKRNTKGYYNLNWVTLRDNFFTCYNSKPIKISSTNVIDEKSGDILCPEDSDYFLKKKYTVDLLESRLYICKKKGRSSFLTCYSESIPAETDLVDITNHKLQNIIETPFGYKVLLEKDDSSFEILLNCLNFGIRTNDGHRFFKVDKVNEFLKWMVAFKFRLGQISLSIGM